MGHQPLKYLPLALALLLCLGGRSPAATAFDPLAVGIGARSLGLGGANAALFDSADTLFGNPAGLGEIDTINFTSLAGNLLEDATYTVLGGAWPLGGRAAIGFGYAGAFVSGIDVRDGLGTLQRRANYGSSVVCLGYGRKLSDRFSWGASLKYYASDGTEFDGGDGRGWNLDVGLL
jgi:hypothetical protein